MTTTIESSGTYNLSSDTVNISGDVITVAVAGTQDLIGVTGSGDSVTVGTYYDNRDGNQVNVAGTDNFVSVLEGFGGVINVGGTNNNVELRGFYDTIGISGASSEVSLAGTGHDVTISTSNSPVSLYAYSDNIDITGAGADINFFQLPSFGPDGQNQITVAGENDALSFAAGSNTVTLSASNTSLNISGDNTNVQLAGSNDTLTITGSNETVTDSGGNNTIVLGNNTSANVTASNSNTILTLQDPASFTGTINNLSPSDTIDLAGVSATGASYDPSRSTLTVTETNGQQLSFDVSGNLSGDSVYTTLLPTGYTQISASSGGDTAAAPAGTSTADNFVWGTNVAGSWDNPSNWSDTTAGQDPATLAPGSNDAVTINPAEGGAENVITGTGNSASLTIGGAAALQGQFTTGALTLEEDASSSITLPSNASLNVTGGISSNDSSTIAVSGGQLTIAGGINNLYYDNLTISGGTATITGDIVNHIGDSLNVSGGSAIIDGNIFYNSLSDHSAIDISGGTFQLDGSVNYNDYADAFYVTGGQAIISGDLNSSPVSGYESFSVSGGGSATIMGSISETNASSFSVSGGSATIIGNVTNTPNSYGLGNGTGDSLTITEGGTLAVGGTVTDQNGSIIQIASGGQAQLGGLSQSTGSVSVDSTSALEIGTAGGAAEGAITIDPGVTVGASIGASFSAPSIVNNGIIDVTSGALTLNGSLMGSGEVKIDSGGNATITSVNSTSANTITFGGTGTLTLTASALNASEAFMPAIYGFDASDAIDIQSTATAASFSNGTLKVTNGGSTIAQLTLNGDYIGDTFDVTPLGNGYTQIEINPAVTQEADSPSEGDEGIGNTILIALTFNKPVMVSGPAPALQLNDGGIATYTGGSGTNLLTFSYTVGASDASVSALAITGATNGASVTDAAGNAADFTAANTSFAGLQIDTQTPIVTNVTANPASGDLNTGAVITLSLTLSEAVTVTGTPVLTLSDGGVATYQSGSGSNTLLFKTTVANAQNTAALAITGNNLNGSTIAIADLAGNPANLAGADVTLTGLQIGATVQSVTANYASGAIVGPGTIVTFTVTTSEPVSITGGTPFLTLNDGGEATYKGGAGTNVLTFNYTVGATGSSQNTPALAITGFSANGATVYDSGIKADTPDLSGVTQFASGPQVDTTAPAVVSVAANPATADLDAGNTVALTAAFTAPVFVTGTPVLKLNDGGTATYVSGSGTSTLTFDYTVQAGQNTSDLTVTGSTLTGATIKDVAGNNANLAGLVTNPAGVLQIDTTAPTVKSVTANPATADLDAGKVVTFTVNFSEAVTVSGGTPMLLLNNNGTAIYQGGSGSAALTFAYTVQPGQDTPDVTIAGVSLGGATIQDGAGNNAKSERCCDQSRGHFASRHDCTCGNRADGDARERRSERWQNRHIHTDRKRAPCCIWRNTRSRLERWRRCQL